MPVTDFERVAYADEMERLKARETLKAKGEMLNSDTDTSAFPFTPGKHYALRTATYTFVQKFERDKVHFDEESQAAGGEVRCLAAHFMMFRVPVRHRELEMPARTGAAFAG